MKTGWLITIWAVGAFLVLGLLGAFFSTSGPGAACTAMACLCGPESDGDIPCNSCSETTHYFYTGLVNVQKTCSGKEMITCSAGEQTGSRIDYDSCEKSFTFGR